MAYYYKPFPVKLVGYATLIGGVLLFVSNSEKLFGRLAQTTNKWQHQISLDNERKGKLMKH